MKLKRIMAMVLCFAMVLSTMSFNVFATETTVNDETALADALATGGRVVLGSNIEVATSVEIPEGVEVTLDLAGFDIIGGLNGTKHVYALTNRGSLTIEDSLGDGEIISRGIYNYADLVLERGTIDACDGDGGMAINNEPGARFIMNGGVVIASNEDGDAPVSGNFDATAIENPAGCETILNGGEVISVTNFTYAIVTSGDLTIPENSTVVVTGAHGALSIGGGQNTIEGGEFICSGYAGQTDNIVYIYGSNTNVEITGGTFTHKGEEVGADSGAAVLVTGASAVVNISGGSFTGLNGALSGNANTTVTGGTFLNGAKAQNHYDDVSKYVPAGFEFDPETGMVVESAGETIVAEVNGELYTDLQEAIKAAAPGGTVNIIDNVVVDKWIMFAEKMTIGNGNLITLNINGLTINGNDYTLTIKSIESAGNGNRLFYDAQNLNINDLTIEYMDDAAKQGGIGLQSGTLSGVNFVGGGYGVLPGEGDITITGCNFKTNSTAIYYEVARDNLVVDNNTFELGDNVNVILLRGDGQFTNNTIVSGRTVNVVSGSPVVTGNDFNNVRLKVYNVATATIEDNEINVLEFNDDTEVKSTFVKNILSAEAKEKSEAAGVINHTKTYEVSTMAELTDALTDADNGDTIALLKDVVLKGKFTITKEITINGNGNSIIADETAVWYTGSGFSKKYNHLIGVNSDNVTLKDIVLDNKNSAGGINVYQAQNVVFDNVSIINATKGMAALTVNGSTLTVKNKFKTLGNAIAIDISNGSNVTSKLGVTVEEGTVFDLDNKTVKFASVAENDMTGAKNADGTPYFAAMDNAYYYTVAQIQSRATEFSNGLKLLADVELLSNLKVKGTLNLNGKTLTLAEGKVINVGSNLTVEGNGTVNGEFILTNTNASITGPEGLNVTTTVEGYVVKYADGKYSAKLAVVQIGATKYASLGDAFAAAQDGDTVTLIENVAMSESATNNKKITLDLNGKTITGTDNTEKNFSLIDNRGDLTITGNGKMTLTATVNSGWNRYSAVLANNPGGKLTIENGTFEHLGGTDMAYGIDNLTNGKGTYAETIINGGTIKSTYRGIRQFLNGVEAQNILTVNGGTVEGANKSIWMQDPSKNANTGNLTITENATINGDVYLSVTAGSTEWPVEIKVATSVLENEIITSNVPAGYKIIAVDGYYIVANDEKLAETIKLDFVDVTETDAEGEKVYNINLTADGKIINRLNSVDLTFALTQINGANEFEIIASEADVAINPVDNSKVRYEFHYKGKTNVTTDTDTTITIGQVKFTGYGKFDFAVALEDAEGNKITTNVAHATKLIDNIVDTFVPGGVLEDGTDVGNFDITDDTITGVEITVPVRELTIDIAFPNAVENNVAAYQDMTVAIVGGTVNETIALGTDGEAYNFTRALPYNTAYTVTVSGAGYRTARYTVTMAEDKTLKFWNNVRDEAQFVEVGKDSSKVNVTFLAGDIVKDNMINIYDLSAVVSYFGTTNDRTAYNDYAKYDLNRDGVIDSKDVAYVLVSWGN